MDRGTLQIFEMCKSCHCNSNIMIWGADMRVAFPLAVRVMFCSQTAPHFHYEYPSWLQAFLRGRQGVGVQVAFSASIKVKCIHYAQHFAWLLIQLSGFKHIFQLVTNSTEFVARKRKGAATHTHSHMYSDIISMRHMQLQFLPHQRGATKLFLCTFCVAQR